MKLSSEDLQELTRYAVEAAQRTGEYIAGVRPESVERKEGGESLASQVVTEVDAQAQELILQILEPTFERYDLALLTEESEDDHSRFEKDYFWCIDPLDGTLAFIESKPGYAVCIALVRRDGEPQIGVVYDPVGQVVYQARKGQGALRNGEPWQMEPPQAGAPLMMITDRSFKDQPHYARTVSAMEKLAAELACNGFSMRLRGGAAMNACWVLESPPACYFKFPKPQQSGGSLWDFAATACIYQEIGAVATDIHGDPLDLNRSDCTFMNHRGTLYATDERIAARIRALYRAESAR